MKYTCALFALITMVSQVNGEQPVIPFYDQLVVTESTAKLNEEFVLTFSVIALMDLPETEVLFEIPNGIELVDGAPYQTIDPNLNDSIPVSLRLKITHPGPYKITVHTIIAPADTISFFQHFAEELYIMCKEDTALYASNGTDGIAYNLISNEIVGEELPAPPPLTQYTVSGTVRYYNKLTYTLDPLYGILVKLFDPATGQLVASARTNSSGYYQMTVQHGVYTLIIFAWNYDAEVHPCWRADVDFFPWPDIDLFCSLEAHRFKSINILLYSNVTVNFDGYEENASRGHILQRIRREKLWMSNHASHTLNFIEVSYPAVIYIDLPAPWEDREYPLTHPLFYAYFGDLEAVKVKTPVFGIWWGVAAYYRNPHQIVIDKDIHIWDERRSVGGITHEWTHGLMVETLGGKVPYGWGHAIHYSGSVISLGHAFSEGFAEFCAPAMWVEQLGNDVYQYTENLEEFYPSRGGYGNSGFPWYRGRSPHTNTNGSLVEGAVMGFLWDLYDNRNTNDHTQDFDDDGVYAGMAKIMNTLHALGSIMTVKTSAWDTLGSEGGDSIAFKSKKAHFPGPNYDFTGKFRERWQAAGYGDIIELCNVDIHPFSYLEPYVVPRPTNLRRAYINHADKQVRLEWQDNTSNEGAFFIYRNLNNSGYDLHHICKVPNTTAFLENIQEGNSYRYKVRALTCDTSNYSNEVTIPTYVAAPSGFTVTELTSNSVNLNWNDNSAIETGFKIARATDGDWNENYDNVSANVTDYVDTVSFLHRYAYKTRAYDSQGHFSDWSNVVEFIFGELAQSDYPEMTAFNNQNKIMIGTDGTIHLLYYNGSKMYYSSSDDQGLNFDPWRWLNVLRPVDTTVGLGLLNNNIPFAVHGGSEWVTGTSFKVRYYTLMITDPLPYPDRFYSSDLTTQDQRATPPSIAFAGDSCYIAFRHFNGSIIVAGPYDPNGTPSIAVSDWGSYPSIGYDKGIQPDPGRIVVVNHLGDYSPFEIHYRSIGQPDWEHITTTSFYAYGSPSVWIGVNEIRLAFEGWDDFNQVEGIVYARFIWTGSSYALQSSAIVSNDFDFDPYGRIGHTSFASKDVVMWRFQEDIWYSQQYGHRWTQKSNISNSPEPSSYPQGAVFGGGSRRKLFALWTEDRNGDYYLVRRIIWLPNVYPYIDVAESSTPEATGYNNSQRLIRDTDGTLHLAFTNGDKVYHTFSQGTSWSEPILVGTGKYPSLSLASDGKIHCTYNFHGYKKFLGKMYYVEYLMSSTFDGLAWSEPLILFHTYGTFLWGVGAPSTAIVDTMAYITFKTYHGPHPNPVPGQPAPHIVVVEGPALIYGKYPTNNPSAYTYDIVDTIIQELPIEVDTLEYRDSLVPQLISPSITVDMEGVKHVLWEGDSIQMRYYTINDTITKELFGAHIGTLVDYPWLTMNEDRVDLFWIRADSIRFRYGWTGSSNLSSIQALATCESPFSSGPYLTWTKQDDYLSYLYYGEMPASGMIEPIEVDYSTNIIGYPQILYNEKRHSESASIDIVWTDYNYFDGLGNIYHLNMPIEEPAPTYVFDMGTETPVPIIVQRDGYMLLGDEDYQTFDYDSTELIYHLTLHTRHKKYKIRWTFYHEEPEKLKLQYSIDDTLFHNRWVQPNEKVVEETWIPQSCLDDDEVTLKVKRTKGTIAVLSGLEIETHFVGGGGPQAGEGQIVKRFLFENMYPNPTKGVLKIRFNSPDERKVTVKIYDVVGRVAEKVFDGKAKVGMNEFLIMPKELSAGVYFVRVEAADFEKTEKIILLR